MTPVAGKPGVGGSRLFLAFAMLCTFLLLLTGGAYAAPSPRVFVIKVHDTIQPVTEEFILHGLDFARRRQADYVLLELGTPGGMLDPAMSIVKAIEESPVPVIVYVDPEAHEVTSTGLLLLASADLAAMAPETFLNPEHPWRGFGKNLNPVQRQQLRTANATLLRSTALRHGRSPEAIEAALAEVTPISANEALRLGLIDAIASTPEELLRDVDGRTVRHADISHVLHTDDATLVPFLPTFRERLLRPLMNPDLAVLLLAVGALLIYLEINTPGTIVPGLAGTFLFLIACFALQMLPLSRLSVGLIFVAIVFILLEAHFSAYGIFALVGIGILVVALATLVSGPIPEMRVGLSTAIGAGIGVGGITAGLAILGIQARRAKVKTGAEAMVGWLAVARTDINPQGQVLVRGEVWQASLASGQKPILTGDRAKISGIDGLTLVVVALNLEETTRRWRSETA